MRSGKKSVPLITLGLVSILGLTIVSVPILAIAQVFVPTPRGLPGRRVGAGTRGLCLFGKPGQPVALLPDTHLGLTTASHPEFFWYVPRTSAQQAEFTLYTVEKVDGKWQRKRIVHKMILEVPGPSGIHSFKLPAHLPPLEVGQDYNWTLTLLCNLQENKGSLSENSKVEGWVQRVVPSSSLAKQLETADPKARVELLAKNSLWFDTLSTLAEMRCANPRDQSVAKSLSSVLKSVQLNEVADQPLLNQCLSGR